MSNIKTQIKAHGDGTMTVVRSEEITDDWRKWLRVRKEEQAAAKLRELALVASIPAIVAIQLLKNDINILQMEPDDDTVKRAVKWLRQNGMEEFTTYGNIV